MMNPPHRYYFGTKTRSNEKSRGARVEWIAKQFTNIAGAQSAVPTDYSDKKLDVKIIDIKLDNENGVLDNEIVHETTQNGCFFIIQLRK